jgi:hypothetical protein
VIRAVLGVCPECLSVPGRSPACAECCSDDGLEIDLVATASAYTPPQAGRRCGYDRFPDPPEPGELHDQAVTRADTGAEVDWDSLPASTRDALDEALVDAAEEDWRDAASARADYEHDLARDRALDDRGEP